MSDSSVRSEELITEFRKYLDWEKMSFDGWEEVEIIIADTLSDAWIKARPTDAYKFEDESFKIWVDEADGKWLCKKDEKDSYKIILSNKRYHSKHELLAIMVHEMRHCLDFINSTIDIPFDKRGSGNRYYNNWSEYRATYAHTRCEYFLKCYNELNVRNSFKVLAELLGKNTADSVEGLMRTRNDWKQTLYYISRYIGASRAVRNINEEERINSGVFSLWYMTPQFIFGNFGNVFYIGNEWEKMNVCDLNAVPKTLYYPELLRKVKNDMQKK